METTLILLKPDTVERGLIGEVISRLENKGLKISGLQMIQLDDAIIAEHYDFLADKPFFPGIQAYMKRTPVVAIAATGVNAIATVRMLTGATNPSEALPGSIRGDFGLTIDANIIHASDSSENAAIELQRFFKGEGVFEYTRVIDEVIS
ncbi:MAG: nucleoside-diphosphate kinase [Candidatus Gracilibacteria bacterium]|nr:nucleoside-diphosphate kinase [Candidatus Gracilibacteria bacterium]